MGHSGYKADSLLWKLVWGRGAQQWAPPANPRTSHRLAAEPPPRRGGRGGSQGSWSDREKGCPPARPGGRGGACRATSPWDLLGGSRLSTGWVLTAEMRLRAKWGFPRGGVLSSSLSNLPAPPPSRVSRCLFPQW